MVSPSPGGNPAVPPESYPDVTIWRESLRLPQLPLPPPPSSPTPSSLLLPLRRQIGRLIPLFDANELELTVKRVVNASFGGLRVDKAAQGGRAGEERLRST